MNRDLLYVAVELAFNVEMEIEVAEGEEPVEMTAHRCLTMIVEAGLATRIMGQHAGRPISYGEAFDLLHGARPRSSRLVFVTDMDPEAQHWRRIGAEYLRHPRRTHRAAVITWDEVAA